MFPSMLKLYFVMIAPQERLDRTPEASREVFDWLLDKLIPLAEQHLLFKFSTDRTPKHERGIVGSKYELPSLVIDSEQSEAVKLTILQEEEIDFSEGGRKILDTTRKLSVDWQPTIVSDEEIKRETSEEIFSADDLGPIDQDRLLAVIERYNTAALLLSSDEAKAKGFSDEAISYLGLKPQTPEI